LSDKQTISGLFYFFADLKAEGRRMQSVVFTVKKIDLISEQTQVLASNESPHETLKF
jgi:hypothetical protein